MATWVLWSVSTEPTDFAQDYFAARALLEGDSIYGDQVASRGRAWFGRTTPANHHPPTNVLLVLPLAGLPYRWAFALLGALSAALFVWSVAQAARATGLAAQQRHLLLTAVLWWPFWACLTHGQVSMVVAAALTAACRFDQQKRSVVAGSLVGAAVLLKLFPALLGLYFLLRRNWVALSAMVAVVVFGFGLAAALVGEEDFVRYWTDIVFEQAGRWSSHPLNFSLQGLSRRLIGGLHWGAEPLVESPWAGRALALLLATVVAVVTLGRGVRLVNQGRLGALRLFGGLCVAALLLSPLTWSHTLAVSLLPLVVALADRSPGSRSTLLLVVAFVLIGFPWPKLGQLVHPLFEGGPVPWVVAAVFQAPTVGLVILWWRLLVGRRTDLGSVQ